MAAGINRYRDGFASATARETRKLSQRLRHAKLRYPASLEMSISAPREASPARSSWASARAAGSAITIIS